VFGCVLLCLFSLSLGTENTSTWVESDATRTARNPFSDKQGWRRASGQCISLGKRVMPTGFEAAVASADRHGFIGFASGGEEAEGDTEGDQFTCRLLCVVNLPFVAVASGLENCDQPYSMRASHLIS
jgi:hypothetical protein